MFKSFEDMSIKELQNVLNQLSNIVEERIAQQKDIDNIKNMLEYFHNQYPNTSMQLTINIHGENHTINILGFLDRIEFKNHSASSWQVTNIMI